MQSGYGPNWKVAMHEQGSFVGAYGDLCVIISAEQARHSQFDAFQSLSGELKVMYPEGYYLLVIATGGRAGQSDEERKLHDALGGRDDEIVATAVVLEGDGLWLATMRVVARTMMMAMRGRNTQIFGSVFSGLDWLASRRKGNASFDPAEAERVLRDLRTQEAA